VVVDWQSTTQPSNAELFELLRKPASGGAGRGRGSRPQGSIADGLATADKKLESTYTVEYIAHAPLEPRAAVAEWTGEFENGKILNGRFADYRLPRFGDAPAIEVVLVDRKDLPSEGAGETPIVGLAPALANAIFNATGLRLRSLPLTPKGIPPPAPF
jgi:CO/xanthine dehydrogenase Mo-binding subunit